MSKAIYIVIDESQTIESVQKKFNSAFPFLKIEFFKDSHTIGSGSKKKRMYESGTIKLINLNKNFKRGRISIEANRTVANLETDFQNQFGLNIQVFRKSGKVWLETSVTDSWTLDEQNKEGLRFSKEIKIEKEDFNDQLYFNS